MNYYRILCIYFANFLFGLSHGRPSFSGSAQQSKQPLSIRLDPRRDCGYLPGIMRRVIRNIPSAVLQKSVDTNIQRRIQSSTTTNHWCLLSTTETHDLWNGTEVRLEFNVPQSYLQNASQATLTFVLSSEDERESADSPEITVSGTVNENNGVIQNFTSANITSDQTANRRNFNVVDFLKDISNTFPTDPNTNSTNSFITIVFFIRQPCLNETCHHSMLNLDLHTPSLRICNLNHGCDL